MNCEVLKFRKTQSSLFVNSLIVGGLIARVVYSNSFLEWKDARVFDSFLFFVSLVPIARVVYSNSCLEGKDDRVFDSFSREN